MLVLKSCKMEYLYPILLHFLVFSVFYVNSLSSSTSSGSIPSSISKEEDEGWLQICDQTMPNQKYEVEASKCPHGAWLSIPVSSGCICLNGLWAVGSSWCDENYRLFLGKGHCFELHGEVQKFAFLGTNPENPLATPSNFMTKKNGHVFKPFKTSVQSPYEYEMNFYNRNLNKTILRLLPYSKQMKEESFLMELTPMDVENSAMVELFNEEGEMVEDVDVNLNEGIVCADNSRKQSSSEEKDKEEGDDDVMLYVYKIKEAIKSLKLTDNCPKDVETYSKHKLDGIMSLTKIRPGQSLHVKSGIIMESSNRCPTGCKDEEEGAIKVIRHRSKRGISKPSQRASLPVALNSSSTLTSPQIMTGPTDEERQVLVNEETLRIVKAEIGFLLDKTELPKVVGDRWRILEKAKEVFAKVCPKVEVPKFLLNAMLRLFRLIFLHSRDFNPYGQYFEEVPQNIRIAKSLDACIEEAEEIHFEYLPQIINSTCKPEVEDKLMNITTANGTTEDWGKANVTYCNCDDKLDKISLAYTKNISNPHEGFNLSRPDFTLPASYSYQLMPSIEKFDGGNRDFPIETTWKIVTFAHYYCAKYFKSHPVDHSAMQVKMETFFNSEILYRWNNPGLRTNETWQALYSSFDMQKFADSVDACVASAKYVSDYPVWIIRPTPDTLVRKKRSVEAEDVGLGKAYCLEDPWDPIHKLGVPVEDPVKDECYEWNNL